MQTAPTPQFDPEGQVVGRAEWCTWSRGYVYLGGQMLGIQYNNSVTWVHQDPVNKSQRLTNGAGTVTSTIELDPWGANTNRSLNSASQSHRFTSYEHDSDGGEDAMMRRYAPYWSRFSQPDPYDGSYSLTNPQSLNRYAYVQNDPVNFTDPTGLFTNCGQNGLPPCPPEDGPDLPSASDYPSLHGFRPMLLPLPRELEPVIPKEPEPTAVPDELQDPDPCAGKTANDLNYRRVRRYRQGGSQSASQHIQSRHMNARSGASQYFGSILTVKLINDLTFSLGTRESTTNGFLFHLELPVTIGTDQNDSHQPTGWNQLRVEKDCKTVDTSYPGRPL